MTGGCEINARQLYSGDCKVILQQVMMLECNEKPQLSGTMNEAIMERIIDIPFNSYFTSDESLVNEKEHIYPINIEYKIASFQEEHRSALFHILLEASKEIYIPKCVASRSKEYVMSSDEIYTWITENFDKGNNDDIITAKDLYAIYCEGDVYIYMTKDEKRIMNKKKFTLLLKSSIAFKGKYRDDRRDINGKSYYERLHGYKLKIDKIEPELI
jgi:phage/plasmid-associated DNA primase